MGTYEQIDRQVDNQTVNRYSSCDTAIIETGVVP